MFIINKYLSTGIKLSIMMLLLTMSACTIQEVEQMQELEITSTAFKQNQLIPSIYTCDGKNINPELSISNIPKKAKSLALIMDDPDAPSGTFVHWVVWNIPVHKNITEDSRPGTQGLNSAGKKGYTGPCPPSGTHRYYFKIYALDMQLNLSNNTKKADLEKAMNKHVLAKGELIGLYSRG